MEHMIVEDVKQLWQEMCELTNEKCGKSPRCFSSAVTPNRCCSPEYCEIAIEAAQVAGLKLEQTNHKSLPLMGEDGCIALPEHRQLCTLHVCVTASLGFDPDDPEWTERYFILREKLNVAMYMELIKDE